MERFSFVFLVAGLGFFALAFAVSAWIPMLPVQHLEVRTVEQLAAIPPLDFLELKDDYPEAYAAAFGGMSDEEAFAAFLAAACAPIEVVGVVPDPGMVRAQIEEAPGMAYDWDLRAWDQAFDAWAIKHYPRK